MKNTQVGDNKESFLQKTYILPVKIWIMLIVSCVYFYVVTWYIVGKYEKKTADTNIAIHNKEMKFLIEDLVKKHSNNGNSVHINEKTGEIEKHGPDGKKIETLGHLSNFTHAPKKFKRSVYYGKGASLKSWLVGMTMGIVFGFIDNYGLFLGMESLEELMVGWDPILKSTVGNTFSDFIGVTVGTSVGASFVSSSGGKPVIWADMFGIMTGCVIGIFIGRLFIGSWSGDPSKAPSDEAKLGYHKVILAIMLGSGLLAPYLLERFRNDSTEIDKNVLSSKTKHEDEEKDWKGLDLNIL